MPTPKVTVLMPVYNAEKFLAEAIESVLNQTFTDFELLVINDGSTDKSREIILSFKDPRLRLLDNESNIRLIATLNKGIELSLGEYIARMDADDICIPQRLEKQVAFMDAHPEVAMCGSFIFTTGLEKNYGIGFETEHDRIKFKLFFDTHFPHPAAMIRKSVLMQHHLRFDKAYIHAEDFEMWNRMADVSRLAIIPEILVLKRSHEEQVSTVYVETQEVISRKIREELIIKLGMKPELEEMNAYEDFLKGILPKERKRLTLLLDLFEKLVVANNATGKYNSEIFNRFFAEKYWNLCVSNTQLGFWVFKKYRSSIFFREKMNSGVSQSRFFLKAMMHLSNHA